MTAATRPRVAFQGEPGAYSDEALHAWFGTHVDTSPARDFDALVGRVARGEADYGVLPVENTLAGTVGPACDAFLEADLAVVGEIVHPIRHCLLAPRGLTLEQVTQVRSHPVALAQCRRFLARHPWMEGVPVHDTAGAARLVAEEPGTSAALASAAAGAAHGLEVLARDVQDRDDNQTRFWVVAGWGTPAPRGPATRGMKSLLAFITRNRPGSLVRVLRTLGEASFNLTSLVARPGGDPWTYRFLAEVEGDLKSGKGAAALEEARSHALELRVLGPYGVLHTADEPEPVSFPRPPSAAHELEEVRQAIDDLDAAFIRLLARRRRLAARAQALRTDAGELLRDPAREARVLRQAVEWGREAGLPDEAIRRLYWSVVALCVPDLSEERAAP